MISKRRAEKIKHVLSRTIKWVFSKQNLDGGVPPYPPERNEKEQRPIVLESGTLASSDFLSVLLRPFIIRQEGKKILPADYIHSWVTVKAESEEDQTKRSVKERVSRLVDFLLDTQLHNNGGFPPLGDVRWISDRAFTDATASAIIALISAERSIDHIHPDSEKQTKYYSIGAAIGKSIKWLFETKRFSDNLDIWIWPTIEGGDSNENRLRVFPIILSAIALNLYSDPNVYSNLPGEAKPIEPNQIKEPLLKIANCLHNKLESQKWIGFEMHSDLEENLSFVNTTLAINFLIDYSRSESTIFKEKVELYRNCFEWLIDKWSEIKGSGSPRYDIDIDRIDLMPLHHETLPPFYDATYARRPSFLFCGLNLWEVSEGESKEWVWSVIESESKILLEILSQQSYYYEFRGKLTPAVSATASVIAFLRKLLQINGYTYSLSDGGD